MKKFLLLLPGSTDPNHNDEYIKRYSLVSEEAIKKSYTSIEILPWVGQDSGPKGIMNLKTASNHLKTKLLDLERKATPYDIIAFSWGANVYLKTLYEIDKPKYLDRTVLWGIDEYWRMVKYFAPYTDTTKTIIQLKNNGALIEPDFLAFEISNEYLLSKYKHTNEILVAFGEKDTKSSPAFANYLSSFVKKPNIHFQIVPGVEHVVTEYNEEYLNCLFG